ncbi:MAG: TIGR01212 family radical SAM protein [Muribaculaceae bacterium]|nr:TIGR01212 family radical SAM protein [Muribaculaceae bacterium]
MKTYGDYLSGIFPGQKVQKISIDAGFTCPNRDGTISKGGCIYCRNDSFSPGYCNSKDSVKAQLEKGKKFFSRKYPEMKYLAYFQSYTGTYNKSIEELSKLYEEALGVEDIVGLVIATRPDCLSDEVLNLLSRLNEEKPVFIELGAETSHDDTLKIINRNHTWEEVENTVKRIAAKGIHCGIHLIAGLPGENREMILQTIKRSVNLPVETIKLHQLQVLKDTLLLQKIESEELEIPDFTLEEYLNLCAEIVKMTPENIVIERFLSQSPPGMVVTPSWGLKNYEFMSKLEKLL